jgi:hypothetical protein
MWNYLDNYGKMSVKEGNMGLKKSFNLSTLLAVSLLGSILIGPASTLGQQGAGGAREGVYVIKKGDTLWDLSQKYLEDPFLWPRLWQSNQYITNPHWIYPGNPIRFYPFEEVRIPPTKPPEIRPPEVRPPEVKPEIAEKPPVEEKPVEEALPPVKPPEVALRPEALPPRDQRWPGFLTREEFPGIGVVVEPKESGRLLMAEGDFIYLAFKTRDPIEIGERFTIFRISPTIKHPLTGEKLGRKVSIMGDCKITAGHGALYTAEILKSFAEIHVGDRITNYQSQTGR